MTDAADRRPGLTVAELSKHFGATAALDAVSLEWLVFRLAAR